MKHHRYIAALVLCLIVAALSSSPAVAFDLRTLVGHSSRSAVPAGASFEVTFSPSPETEASILRFISEARVSVHVAAYSFTSKSIAAALLAASKKGLDVRVVVDKSNLSKYSAASFLANQGVPVRVDSVYAIQHQKVIIVDGKSVELGSYNYSQAARDKNSECVLILREVPQLAASFEKNWGKMWGESQNLAPRY